MIQAQKRALDARIRQFTSSHIVYPGMTYWKEGGESKPPLLIDDIPGKPSWPCSALHIAWGLGWARGA